MRSKDSPVEEFETHCFKRRKDSGYSEAGRNDRVFRNNPGANGKFNPGSGDGDRGRKDRSPGRTYVVGRLTGRGLSLGPAARVCLLIQKLFAPLAARNFSAFIGKAGDKP